MALRQLTMRVLQPMQVLDQQISSPRLVGQQRSHLCQRCRFHLAALWLAARATFAATGMSHRASVTLAQAVADFACHDPAAASFGWKALTESWDEASRS
jgi:hypothetical protein